MRSLLVALVWYWKLNETMWQAIKPYGFAIIFLGIAILQVIAVCK